MVLKLVAFLIVTVTLLSGVYLATDSISIIFNPVELLVIFGLGIGAWLSSIDGSTIKDTFSVLGMYFRGTRNDDRVQHDVVEFVHHLTSVARKNGPLESEKVIDNLKKGKLSDQFYYLSKERELISLIGDALELSLTDPERDISRIEKAAEIAYMRHFARLERVPNSIGEVADWMPGFGIIAAIIGIISALGLLKSEMDMVALASAISIALSGTLMGVFLSFAVLSPIAHGMQSVIDQKKILYLQAMRLLPILSSSNINPRVARLYAEQYTGKKTA